MKKQLGTGLGILALAIALTGCGGSPGASSTSSSASSPAASSSAASSSASSGGSSSSTSAGAAELKTASSSFGERVVAANGKSVYIFAKDAKDSGKSACTGGCATLWPPVTTTSAMPAVDGVSGTIGTIPTADGKMQITVNGMPIYFYSKDEDSGDTYGQGVGGVWSLVSPSGSMVTPSSSTTPSSSSMGY
ncbi:COG4315 family predicted lipoprotein [Arthrobacter sp. KN11-1C]|uniref:COG4315 family predicted lipoprotein n=1 Tax=Arthrobacter sp. KN11-1C TaxID=3445774 RepID=UPI003F9F0316